MLGLHERTRQCATIPPLAGHTVGVTGDRRAEELASLLHGLGATTVHGPMLRTRPDGDGRGELWAATAAIVACPPAYLLATTGIGIRSWFGVAATWGLRSDLRHALDRTAILARGPKVAGALSAEGLTPSFVEPTGRTDAMVGHLPRGLLGGTRVAVQRPGSDDQDHLVERLSAAGANVISVDAYDVIPPPDPVAARRLLRALVERRLTAVTFTSRAAVRGLFELALGDGVVEDVAAALATTVVPVCVGAVTATEVSRRFGAPHPAVPDEPTLGALAEATAEAVRRRAHHHVRAPDGTDVVVQGRLVRGGGVEVQTSEREAAVLQRVLANAGRPVSGESLLRTVWAGEAVDPSVLDTTMTRLRRRLSDTGLTVLTIRRRGYRLDGDVVPCAIDAAT